MSRKIFGTIFILAGVALAAVLYAEGMFVFPHLTGPIVVAAVGAILLVVKRKAKKTTKPEF